MLLIKEEEGLNGIQTLTSAMPVQCNLLCYCQVALKICEDPSPFTTSFHSAVQMRGFYLSSLYLLMLHRFYTIYCHLLKEQVAVFIFKKQLKTFLFKKVLIGWSGSYD